MSHRRIRKAADSSTRARIGAFMLRETQEIESGHFVALALERRADRDDHHLQRRIDDAALEVAADRREIAATEGDVGVDFVSVAEAGDRADHRDDFELL